MARDWLKLYRSIVDTAFWHDDWLVRLWIWCLVKANYSDSSWRGLPIRRGEFITGRNSAADELGVSPSKWLRGVMRLVDLGCIKYEANSNWTRLTVCNYVSYQDGVEQERTTNGQPADSQRTAVDTTNGQPADTREEGKKVISTGTGPGRVAASEKSEANITGRAALASMIVRALPPNGMTNGHATAAIETITDRPRLVEWWRKHLGTGSPLTGPTALDLLHVLCCAVECSRCSAKNKVAAFAKRMASGKWVDAQTGMESEYAWLSEQINTGRIEVEQS